MQSSQLIFFAFEIFDMCKIEVNASTRSILFCFPFFFESNHNYIYMFRLSALQNESNMVSRRLYLKKKRQYYIS